MKKPIFDVSVINVVDGQIQTFENILYTDLDKAKEMFAEFIEQYKEDEYTDWEELECYCSPYCFNVIDKEMHRELLITMHEHSELI